MPTPHDAPPLHASGLFKQAVERAGLTEAQVEILKQGAASALLPADLFSPVPLERILERLRAVELLIAASVPREADFKERARWQQQLAIHARREELLARRQARYPACWCFGFGGRDEIGLVAFHPDHTHIGWDGATRRLPLSAPLALATAGISDRTFREICRHCPEGRAALDERERGERLIQQDFLHRQFTHRWQRTGIPEQIRRFSLDAYPDQRKIARIEAWYRGERQPGQDEYRAGLIMAGHNQRGKSTIGYLLGAFDAGRGVLCRTMPDLFGELTATFDADARQNRDPEQPPSVGHQELLDSLKTVWLLMLDDLGTEKESEYTERTLFQILEARKQAGDGLRTIVTTNLKQAEMADRFGVRTWGRLSGLFTRSVIDWPLMGPAADGLPELDDFEEGA
jgi:hypothetical protein